jgi:hypothetical protein
MSATNFDASFNQSAAEAFYFPYFYPISGNGIPQDTSYPSDLEHPNQPIQPYFIHTTASTFDDISVGNGNPPMNKDSGHNGNE